LDQGVWTHAPRLPLGDPYRGACHAHSSEVFEPDEIDLRDLCNCGYARGRCERFPQESVADAARFSIAADEDDRVQLIYVLEKDYAPVEYGALHYAVGQDRMTGAQLSMPLERQARAFLESYLRRR
jgi:hypothetical protein